MSGKYILKVADNPTEWDAWVDASAQGTVFSHTSYLQGAGRRYALYYVFKGGEKKAGIALAITDDGDACELDDLVIYNGILFKRDEVQKQSKGRFERFEITEFVINNLVQMFSRVEMALSPHFEDLRPFLWHNYHSRNTKDKFVLDLRYTSYLRISELCYVGEEEATELFKGLQTLRQRNIREARRAGARVKIGADVELFVSFYDALMLLQGEQVPREKLVRIKNLIMRLLKEKKAILFYAENGLGEVMYIAIFGFDTKRAYYLFGAGNPNSKEGYKGTITFWDSFKHLATEHGICEIDMEGVNSPRRGWFKLSFGGGLHPYYQVYKHP